MDDRAHLTLVVEDLHIHVHHHVEGAPDAHAVLTAIRDLEHKVMTELNKAAVKETTDSAALVDALGHMGDALTALRSENNDALKKALADAGADADATTNILSANDAAIEAALVKANALLTQAPVEGTGQDTTTGGETTTDTVQGGNAGDTLSAGGGTDTIVGGNAGDSVEGGAAEGGVTVTTTETAPPEQAKPGAFS